MVVDCVNEHVSERSSTELWYQQMGIRKVKISATSTDSRKFGQTKYLKPFLSRMASNIDVHSILVTTASKTEARMQFFIFKIK